MYEGLGVAGCGTRLAWAGSRWPRRCNVSAVSLLRRIHGGALSPTAARLRRARLPRSVTAALWRCVLTAGVPVGRSCNLRAVCKTGSVPSQVSAHVRLCRNGRLLRHLWSNRGPLVQTSLRGPVGPHFWYTETQSYNFHDLIAIVRVYVPFLALKQSGSDINMSAS